MGTPASASDGTQKVIVVFSSTKGAVAICANQLAQEGRLAVNAPVADSWPEFAQAGKENIPVDHLLSHRAGLPWVDEQLTLENALAWDPMIHALEQQKLELLMKTQSREKAGLILRSPGS